MIAERTKKINTCTGKTVVNYLLALLRGHTTKKQGEHFS